MVFDLGALADSAQQFAANSEDLRRRIDELETEAESADGRVKARWTSAGLAGVDLDPRALRMAAADLGELITETVQDAQRKFERQAAELTTDSFGPNGDPMAAPPSAEEAAAFITDMHSTFEGTLQETTAIIDNMRRAFQQR
ncbi:YbaB/EbfC family nucleoid-associated protein [Actinomadura formosensis]|uniref:YbaB/EbfC family nucleoid-associated protein n=1 Tax=Actinomadura formosensis TaxID=60706 RepID=UPI0008372E4C|nr:YbaB/EbfC family nucleoid-associated protein [Actinomadura formosensis]